MDDLNKERIRFNIEIIKLLALLFVATGGGTLALVVERGGLELTLQWALVYGGMLFATISGVLAIAVTGILKKAQTR